MSGGRFRHGKGNGFPFFLDHEYQEFRRPGFTGIGRLAVDVMRSFVEGVSRPQGDRCRPVDLHDHRAFQHVNVNFSVVAVSGRDAPGRSGHGQHEHFLARHFGQVLLQELLYGDSTGRGCGGPRWIRSHDGAAERSAQQGADGQ